MIFTTEEQRLIHLFHSGSIKATISVVSDALPDIIEPDVHAVAISVLGKLESISGVEYNSLIPESEGCYAGA